MIELQRNRLLVSFPELHPDAKCSLEFQRTLRIPDDNQDYPLPAGLGAFPLLPVDDFNVSPEWKRHGGVFLPMWQSEAMWLNFTPGMSNYPMAIKVAAGKINAVTGEPWANDLQESPQDYVVIPGQPWLDGFCVAKGVVKQFVAAPLGQGLTAEEQLTGEGQWGGLQIAVYPMKISAYQRLQQERRGAMRDFDLACSSPMFSRAAVEDMGLAAGGRIHQDIAEDAFGFDVWDTSALSRCFVHILNSEGYHTVTGRQPPTAPITPKQYAEARIPWFDYYHDGRALPGASTLAKLDGLASALFKKGSNLPNNAPISISKTIVLGKGKGTVRDGDF